MKHLTDFIHESQNNILATLSVWAGTDDAQKVTAQVKAALKTTGLEDTVQYCVDLDDENENGTNCFVDLYVEDQHAADFAYAEQFILGVARELQKNTDVDYEYDNVEEG